MNIDEDVIDEGGLDEMSDSSDSEHDDYYTVEPVQTHNIVFAAKSETIRLAFHDNGLARLLRPASEAVEIDRLFFKTRIARNGWTSSPQEKFYRPCAVCQTADNRYMLAACHPNAIHVYDLLQRPPCRVHVLTPSQTESAITAIATCQDVLVVGLRDGTILMYRCQFGGERDMLVYRASAGSRDLSDMSPVVKVDVTLSTESSYCVTYMRAPGAVYIHFLDGPKLKLRRGQSQVLPPPPPATREGPGRARIALDYTTTLIANGTLLVALLTSSELLMFVLDQSSPRPRFIGKQPIVPGQTTPSVAIQSTGTSVRLFIGITGAVIQRSVTLLTASGKGIVGLQLENDIKIDVPLKPGERITNVVYGDASYGFAVISTFEPDRSDPTASRVILVDAKASGHHIVSERALDVPIAVEHRTAATPVPRRLQRNVLVPQPWFTLFIAGVDGSEQLAVDVGLKTWRDVVDLLRSNRDVKLAAVDQLFSVLETRPAPGIRTEIGDMMLDSVTSMMMTVLDAHQAHRQDRVHWDDAARRSVRAAAIVLAEAFSALGDQNNYNQFLSTQFDTFTGVGSPLRLRPEAVTEFLDVFVRYTCHLRFDTLPDGPLSALVRHAKSVSGVPLACKVAASLTCLRSPSPSVMVLLRDEGLGPLLLTLKISQACAIRLSDDKMRRMAERMVGEVIGELETQIFAARAEDLARTEPDEDDTRPGAAVFQFLDAGLNGRLLYPLRTSRTELITDIPPGVARTLSNTAFDWIFSDIDHYHQMFPDREGSPLEMLLLLDVERTLLLISAFGEDERIVLLISRLIECVTSQPGGPNAPPRAAMTSNIQAQVAVFVANAVSDALTKPELGPRVAKLLHPKDLANLVAQLIVQPDATQLTWSDDFPLQPVLTTEEATLTGPALSTALARRVLVGPAVDLAPLLVPDLPALTPDSLPGPFSPSDLAIIGMCRSAVLVKPNNRKRAAVSLPNAIAIAAALGQHAVQATLQDMAGQRGPAYTSLRRVDPALAISYLRQLVAAEDAGLNEVITANICQIVEFSEVEAIMILLTAFVDDPIEGLRILSAHPEHGPSRRALLDLLLVLTSKMPSPIDGTNKLFLAALSVSGLANDEFRHKLSDAVGKMMDLVPILENLCELAQNDKSYFKYVTPFITQHKSMDSGKVLAICRDNNLLSVQVDLHYTGGTIPKAIEILDKWVHSALAEYKQYCHVYAATGVVGEELQRGMEDRYQAYREALQKLLVFGSNGMGEKKFDEGQISAVWGLALETCTKIAWHGKPAVESLHTLTKGHQHVLMGFIIKELEDQLPPDVIVSMLLQTYTDMQDDHEGDQGLEDVVDVLQQMFTSMASRVSMQNSLSVCLSEDHVALLHSLMQKQHDGLVFSSKCTECGGLLSLPARGDDEAPYIDMSRTNPIRRLKGVPEATVRPKAKSGYAFVFFCGHAFHERCSGQTRDAKAPLRCPVCCGGDADLHDHVEPSG